MAVSDPIADMLTRIRNAHMANHRVVEIPASRLKREIARILQENNFIRKFVVVDDGKQGVLKILLKYAGHVPAIQGIRRASSPGLRRYAQVGSMPKVKNGLGIAVISTSKGLMTDAQARENKVGGEVLCHVW